MSEEEEMKFFSDIKGRSRFLSRWPTPPLRENSGLKQKIEENLREWRGLLVETVAVTN